jgi:hypothetical protein
MYLRNYILFIDNNIETDEITCLQHIHPDYITLLGNIYNKNRINTNYDNGDLVDFIKEYIENIDKNDKEKRKNIRTAMSSVISLYTKTKNEMNKELTEYYNEKITKDLII